MRISTTPLWIWPLAAAPLVAGFTDHSYSKHAAMHKRCPYANDHQQAVSGHENGLLAELLKSPVDVTGEHAFQPPDFETGDQRGPCPGLNALANHGYIPRNGVVSFGGAITAINEVYGMGVDLATVLALMGTVWTGNPLSLDPRFSIGGRDIGVNNLLGNLGGLLGDPQGLIGSHNFIESDSSNTRDDIYVTGNNHKLNMDKFMSWYNMSTDGTFDMDLMAKRAKLRFDETVQSNPNFYYGPVTGLIARNAGYIFPARLFRNYSQEEPNGVLTKEHIRNFYGIYGEEGNFTYREGWERIPDNWYKTPVNFGLVQLNLDIIDWLSKYPELGSIGGNTGTVNSFAGVDLGNLTGGVFNLGNLLEGNNLLCLAFEVLKFAGPNALSGLFKSLAEPLEFITNALSVPLLNVTCPAFKDLQVGGKPFWEVMQKDFPGAMKSGGAF
ncbi:peroxidase family protein [Aspergillus niger CBS 101883]|uniref:peroxidase family protein n=1 Tax=Aspergillus lacticoffeatus (strain CBS 101883) TaxID=1450533 RepID=UPI000D7EE15A|nr:oxidase [Aspergillus niger CBS 101883]PYH53343.1 oxidase [Aspergillus niger CBS 101883]